MRYIYEAKVCDKKAQRYCGEISAISSSVAIRKIARTLRTRNILSIEVYNTKILKADEELKLIRQKIKEK